MANNAISAQGSTLGVATTAQLPTYTNIGQLTDFSIGTGQASKLDASNLASTSKEYIAGLSDHGALTLKGQYDSADAGQTLLRTNQGNGVLLHFKGTFPDSETGTFDAEVAEFTVTAGTDKVLEFQATIWPRDVTWS